MDVLRNNKKTILIFLFVIIIVAGFNFYRNRPKDDSLVLYGNVDIRQISLAFNASERIEKMNAEEGDHVKKGDVLATLNTQTLQLAIAQTKAQIASQNAAVAKLHNGSRPEEIMQAQASVNTMAAEEENARTYYQRMQSLYDKNAVSRQSRDDAEARWKAAAANLENAKASLQLSNIGPRQEDIAAAEAQLEALKVTLKTHEYNLSQATLVAPQDGVIRSRLLEPGDMASPSKPVYMIGLENAKWVRAYISEKRLGEVKEGMEATVTSESFPDHPIKGQVGYISNTAEFTPKSVQTEELRSSLLYEIRVYVNDENNMLRMGMPATVKF